jgi:two-component system response regulator AtoC
MPPAAFAHLQPDRSRSAADAVGRGRGTGVILTIPATLQIPSLSHLPIDLQRFLDDIPLGIVLLDTQRRVVFLNRVMEALTGLSSETAAGVPCFHVVRSRVCLQHCVTPAGSRPRETVCFESDMINRDRKRIPIRSTVAPLVNPKEGLIGFVETVEDLRPLKALDQTVGHAYSFGHIVGKSEQMERLFGILPIIAQNDSSVLIIGETGTGKDLLAEALHQASGRAKGAFVKINCGALPEPLLESELFGHKKGAFTGAVSDKPGRFLLAKKGTLYLTEIGDLPLALQVKLLTFLDDKTVFPLGSTRGYEADVRIIAATHHDLEEMVRKGHFRQDLFFRLNVLRLQLPALREREGDVRLLLDHFLHAFATKFSRPIRAVSPPALQLLLDYPYPGNVRELKNIVEYAVNICQNGEIQPEHLPAYLAERPTIDADIPPNIGRTPSPIKPNASSPGRIETDQKWPDIEKRMILEALLKSKGNKTRAAALLGCARSTLWRKIKLYGIDD